MTWDDYYMTLVVMVATKSKDPSTKCGAIIVSDDNRVLSIGYNGPPRGYPDQDAIKIKRPMKYHYWIHAEENALLNYNGSKSDLVDSTIYVTGKPCVRCLRGIIQSGVKHIVFQSHDTPLAMYTYEEGNEEAWDLLIEHSNVTFHESDFTNSSTDLLNDTIEQITMR